MLCRLQIGTGRNCGISFINFLQHLLYAFSNCVCEATITETNRVGAGISRLFRCLPVSVRNQDIMTNLSGAPTRYTLMRNTDVRYADLIKIALFAVASLLIIETGLAFSLDATRVSLVWPMTGVSLAVLLLGGKKYAIGLWLALLTSNLMRGMPLLLALGVACGSTAMALFGAYTLQKRVDFRPSLERIRDIVGFVVVGVVISPLISAAIGTLCFTLAERVPLILFPVGLFTWWIGDAMGVLVVAPVVLIWATVPFRIPARRNLVEAAILLVLLLVIAWLIFGQGFGGRGFYPLACLIFPFLIWGALRFDQRTVVTLTLLVSMIAVVTAANEFGSYSQQMIWAIVLFLWAYLATMAISSMLLAATLGERRSAEQTARSLEARFARAFHAAPVAMWISQIETGRFVDANAEFTTVFGYRHDELIGKTSLELNIWETPEMRADLIRQVSTQGHLEQSEAHLRDRGGRMRSGLLSVDLMELDGAPHLLNMFHDMTARQEAETALRESEAHYRQLFEGIDDAIFVYDLNGKLLDVNEAASRLLGYSREELLQMHLGDLDAPSFASGFTERIQKQVEQGYLNQIEGSMIARDGHEILIEINSKLITYGGQPAILGVDRDVTERKLSEQRLRESENRYRAIVEDQTEMICRLTPDWKLNFVNDAFCKYHNTPREALLDTYFRPTIYPDDEARVRNIVNSLSPLNPVITAEYRIMMPQGAANPTPRWHQWTHRAVLDEQGAIREYQLVGKDITMLKEIESQRLAITLEHEKVQILADFIASASHDFRTPLSVINTSAYLLNRITEETQRKRHLEQIQDQTYHIEKLIDGLLTMTRLDRGDVFRFRPTNINIIVQQVALKKQALVEEKSITLQVDLAPDLPVIEADTTWIHTAMTNLLDNAIHFTPQGGMVNIGTCIEQNWISIIVSDTGTGISEEDMPHIFKRLYRGEGHRPVGGQGLGLPMVARIAEAHLGRVEVESQPGGGSTFRLVLPVKRSDTNAAPSPDP